MVYDKGMGRFFMVDLNSRYGTLVRVGSGGLMVRPNFKGIRVQVGSVGLELNAIRGEGKEGNEKMEMKENY